MIRGTPRSDRYADTVKMLRNVTRAALHDEEYRKEIGGNWVSWNKARFILFKRAGRIATNVLELKKQVHSEYQKLFDLYYNDPYLVYRSLEKYLPEGHMTDPDDVPKILYKYVKKDFACKSVKNNELKFGSAKEYRESDSTECDMGSAMTNPRKLSPSDKVQMKIIKDFSILEGVDFKGIMDGVDATIDDKLFIGCFTTHEDSDYMWHEYAGDDGVCITVDTRGLALCEVLYRDKIANYDILKERFNELMILLSIKKYDSIKSDIELLLSEIICLSLLTFYRKDNNEKYPKEGEWRVLVPYREGIEVLQRKDKNYILQSIPEKFLTVRSKMPKEYNDQMKVICESRGIKFVDLTK